MADIIELGKRVKEKYPGVYDKIPDVDLGRRVKEAHPDAYSAFTDVSDESAPKRFARGAGDAVLGQAKGALLPEGLGGDRLPVDSEGNIKMPYSDGDMLHRGLASVHPALPALYDSIAHGDRARALGQTAANLPGLIQGLFGHSVNLGGAGGSLPATAQDAGKAAGSVADDVSKMGPITGPSGTPQESQALMQSLPNNQHNPFLGMENPLSNIGPGVTNLLLRGHPGLRLARGVLRAGKEVMGDDATSAASSTPNPLRDWVKAQDPVQPSGRTGYANPYNEAEAAQPPVANDPYARGRSAPNVDPMEKFRGDGIPTEELLSRIEQGPMEYGSAPSGRALPESAHPQPNSPFYQRPPMKQVSGVEADPYDTPPAASRVTGPIAPEDANVNIRQVQDQLGIGRQGPMEYENPQVPRKVKPAPVPADSPYYQAPAVKVKAKPVPAVTGATDSWDQGFRPTPAEQPVAPQGQPRVPSEATAPMDFDAPAPKLKAHQTEGGEGTPPPAQAQPSFTPPATAKVPSQTVAKPSVQAQLGLERPAGVSDSDWQGMLNRQANRQARAKEAVEYFNKKGITVDQLKEWQEQFPPSGANRQHGGLLAEHARTFGNKRPFSESIVQEIIRTMGLGGGQ